MNNKRGTQLIVVSFLLYGLFLLPSNYVSANPILQSGTYIELGGNGKLVIDHASDAKLTFSMEIVRVNGHTCDLEGSIQDGHAILSSDGNSDENGNAVEPCFVLFTSTPDGVEVKARDARSCQRYCGSRADLSETLYFMRPHEGCDTGSLASSRKNFKRLYEGHKFSKAEAILVPILANCKKTLEWFEEARIRNDLAITQYHLGHTKDCLETLNPLMSDAEVPDDELNFAPGDSSIYLPILHSARTNIRLCKR